MPVSRFFADFAIFSARTADELRVGSKHSHLAPGTVLSVGIGRGTGCGQFLRR